MTFKYLPLIVFALLVLLARTSVSAEFITESGNKFSVSMGAEYGYTDNFLYENKQDKRTNYLKLSPSLAMQAEFGRTLLKFDAQTSHVKYDEFSSDDHSDFSVTPKLYYKISHNQTLYLSGKASKNYQERGRGLSLGKPDTLVKGDDKKLNQLNSGYLYGTSDSIAKVAIDLSHQKMRYSTRRNETYLVDNETDQILTSFDYLLSGRTYIATELSYQSVSIVHNSVLDKNILNGLLGVKWQSTELTKLDVLFGYQEISFKEKGFSDDKVFSWKVGLDWSPLEYAQVNFNSQRSFNDADRIEDSYRVSDLYHIDIGYNFSSFFRLNTDFNYQVDEIISSFTSEAEDYFDSSISLIYMKNDWLSLFLKYQFQKLEAERDELNYQRNGISMGFNVSI